jgi:type II secretory pathway pseudopilin PulG
MKASHWWAWRRSERGFLTLIALLVVIVIIGILFATQMGGLGGGGSSVPGEPGTMLGGAVNRADATVCRNNLNQLRSAIAIYQANNGAFPPSLEALQSNVSLALTCPVGGEPYQYDATTGQVHCVHPGHEGF